MINIDSVLTLAKSFTTKVAKDESGLAVTLVTLKFTGLQIARDVLDELLGMPVGWCSGALFDEQGAPLRRFGIRVYGHSHRASGTIKGTKPSESLKLLQADLEDIDGAVIPLGAIIEGSLTWAARGDEVEDLSPLLGKACTAKWEITTEESGDLFRQSAATAHASRVTQQVLDGLKRGHSD